MKIDAIAGHMAVNSSLRIQADDTRWTAALTTAEDSATGGAAGAPGMDGDSPSALAGSKDLAELLLSQTLRAIMPKGAGQDRGLAFDTWRDMLSDTIARAAAPSFTGNTNIQEFPPR